MSKSIKLNEYLELQKEKQSHFTKSTKASSFSIRNAVKITIVMLSIIALATILTLAYNYEAIYFKNIIVGLFIIGTLLLIKNINEQKTSFTRVKK